MTLTAALTQRTALFVARAAYGQLYRASTADADERLRRVFLAAYSDGTRTLDILETQTSDVTLAEDARELLDYYVNALRTQDRASQLVWLEQFPSALARMVGHATRDVRVPVRRSALEEAAPPRSASADPGWVVRLTTEVSGRPRQRIEFAA